MDQGYSSTVVRKMTVGHADAVLPFAATVTIIRILTPCLNHLVDFQAARFGITRRTYLSFWHSLLPHFFLMRILNYALGFNGPCSGKGPGMVQFNASDC